MTVWSYKETARLLATTVVGDSARMNSCRSVTTAVRPRMCGSMRCFQCWFLLDYWCLQLGDFHLFASASAQYCIMRDLLGRSACMTCRTAVGRVHTAGQGRGETCVAACIALCNPQVWKRSTSSQHRLSRERNREMSECRNAPPPRRDATATQATCAISNPYIVFRDRGRKTYEASLRV